MSLETVSLTWVFYRDILHPNRANISKEELRDKLAALYKAQKDQVSVFGLRTQFGGGKTTGFALVYDSPEAMKKFEPHYRLVRVGLATKIEKASRQQRTFRITRGNNWAGTVMADIFSHKQASSARTARRPSVALPRSRAPSPRRRNKRRAFFHFGASSILHRFIEGWAMALVSCAFFGLARAGFNSPAKGSGVVGTIMQTQIHDGRGVNGRGLLIRAEP